MLVQSITVKSIPLVIETPIIACLKMQVVCEVPIIPVTAFNQQTSDNKWTETSKKFVPKSPWCVYKCK